MNSVTVRTDKSGRVVFPKNLREKLGIRPDMELEAIENSGGLLLRPRERESAMVQVAGLWVHQGSAPPNTNWEQALDDGREERSQSLLKRK